MNKILELLAAAALAGAVAMPICAAEFYVSDAGNFGNPPWQILKFDENGGNPEVFISEALGWPQDLVFLENQGVVLVSNLITNRINRHDIETGAFIDVFASNADGPTRMKIGADGLLYVLQWQGDGRVLRYELDGTFVGAFTDVGVSQAIGIDWDAQGRLYVSSFQDRSVRRFDSQGRDLGLFVTTNLNGPTNIEFADNGDLLVVDWQGGAIRRFSDQGSFIEAFAVGLSQPEGIARMPGGDLLIGNGGSGSVRRYGPEGEFLGDFITAGAGGLLQPNAVVVRETFEFDYSLDVDGQWVSDDPDTAGNAQGLTFDFLPSANLLFMAWYTYTSSAGNAGDEVGEDVGAADNRWMTGQLPIDGNTATGPLFVTTGGRFDAPLQDSQPTVQVGTVSVTFSACDRALIEYSIDSPALANSFPIVPLELRINPAVPCQSEASGE